MDAVRLAEKLKTTYPDKNFVPVFWMASEDHDFEEINHLHLFGSTFSWETEQKGPVENRPTGPFCSVSHENVLAFVWKYIFMGNRAKRASRTIFFGGN